MIGRRRGVASGYKEIFATPMRVHPYVSMLSKDSRFLHLALATLFSVVSLGSIYSVQAYLEAPKEPGSIRVSGSPAFPEIQARQPLLEVHIANNGHAHLRGAKIIAIYKGKIDVLTKWGLADFTWTVDTTSSTRYVGKNGEYVERGDLQVGDFIAITGSIAGVGRSPEIDARYVRLSR